VPDTQEPPDLRGRPIGERIEWLFEHARRHSTAFCTPEACLARERYLARHPTAVVVMKCMDGRINFSVATKTPLGIIQPLRNLGGMFDLGWPHLGEVLTSHVQRVVRAGRQVVLLITYHYSRGDPKRGCAGFGFNTQAAIAHTQGIRAQVEHTFGRAHQTVYPIVCGFETDEDAIVLHGPGEAQLDLAQIAREDTRHLASSLDALYPDIPTQVRDDLLPLLRGNVERIAEVRASSRKLDVEHREWMVCLGRGFDFLHMPHLALIIGPYSPDLGEPIRRAARIIDANMAAKRIPDDGFLLLASSPYDDIGVDRARAELKSRFLSGFATEVVRRHHPALAARMRVCTAVLDWRSRELQVLDTF
jgi:hypothetical protein